MHMLTEGDMDMWSLSPGLHVAPGHICLAVGLEWVWGRIVSVYLCVPAYMNHVSMSWHKETAGSQSPVQAGRIEGSMGRLRVPSSVTPRASQACIPTPSTDHPHP